MADDALEELGKALRERREALDLTREELSRQVGVTPAYIFMVEGARPRSSGSPSRPKRETLKRWTEALGLGESETNRILQMTGYHPLEPELETHLETVRGERPEFLARRGMMRAMQPPPPAMPATAFPAAAAPPPGSAPASSRSLLLARLERLLGEAERRRVLEETVRELMEAVDRIEEEMER